MPDLVRIVEGLIIAAVCSAVTAFSTSYVTTVRLEERFRAMEATIGRVAADVQMMDGRLWGHICDHPSDESRPRSIPSH